MKFIKLMKQIKSAEQPTTPKPTTQLPQNMEYAWDPQANQWIAVMKDNPSVTPPTYNPSQTNMYSTTTTGMTPIKSSLVECLNNFIDGDRYSKEIKIEAGLIKDGFITYSGFDMYKGTKYSITQKGLEYLKQAAQQEYDLEKEHLDAKKSYLLDGISESELQTGDVTYKGLMPKKTYSVFEVNGEELAKDIEASSEVDAKVKFILQHPEYEDSQTIYVKESGKEVDANYSETTNEALTYPNPGVSPSTDIELENHDGWVNTAGIMDKVREGFAKDMELAEQLYNKWKNISNKDLIEEWLTGYDDSDKKLVFDHLGQTLMNDKDFLLEKVLKKLVHNDLAVDIFLKKIKNSKK